MRIPARKLTMQLTPLLDLLLIVIFAQYMEVRDTEGARLANAAALRSELEQTRDESERLRAMLGGAADLLETAEQAMIDSRQSLEQQRIEQEETQAALDRANERQVILGRLVAELFNVPQAVVDAVLDPNRTPPVSESTEELQRLRERFREMAEASPGEVVRHLLAFEEIRKRTDIWEVHFSTNPRELTLDDDGTVYRFVPRLESEQPAAPLDAEHFERELYGLMSSLPQPKGLVIVLLTYDGELRNNVVEPARVAAREALQRMRVNSGGRSQFEFADLGVRIE
jgi:hypothetical protein